MKLKKLLSIFLSMSCVFSSVSARAFAKDYCDSNKNSKGGYIDYVCANPELAKVWKNQANYATVKNLGPDGDDEYYCFNFRALDDIFKERKLISTAALEREGESLNKACEAPIYGFATNATILFTGLLGAVGGYLFQMWSNYATTKETKLGDSDSTSAPSSRTPSPTRHEVNTQKNSVLPTCIGALISVLVSSICFYFNGTKKKDDACKKRDEVSHQIYNINEVNERNSNMLKLLLKSLERPELIRYADMFCFYDTFHSHGTPFGWETKDAGINYTKEEMASFPEKFKEIANKIRKNLEDNGYLTPDNENGGKVLPGQGEIGD